MTRINLVPPSELYRKHLQAEYYELPEIFRLVFNRQLKGYTPADSDIPPTYRFGVGHKRFFYDKLAFLYERHMALVNEMHIRGFKANLPVIPQDLKAYWFGHWEPPQEAIDLSRARIQQRIKELNWK